MRPSAILAEVETHALTSGLFERVNTHECASPPGRGLTCEIWTGGWSLVPATSGLAVVSMRLELVVRLLCFADREPRDTIDTDLDVASHLLGEAYAGDFTLGGEVSEVDLLGAHGPGLACVAGYVLVDSTRYRTRTITLPLIIDDVWTEAP